MARQTLRASEIASYVYCRRAWWYEQQGYPSSHTELRRAGEGRHQEHGRQVVAAGCLRALAYLCLLAGLAAGAASLVDLALR